MYLRVSFCVVRLLWCVPQFIFNLQRDIVCWWPICCNRIAVYLKSDSHRSRCPVENTASTLSACEIWKIARADRLPQNLILQRVSRLDQRQQVEKRAFCYPVRQPNTYLYFAVLVSVGFFFTFFSLLFCFPHFSSLLKTNWADFGLLEKNI